jgi:Tol biopolymer transport system component
MELLSLLARTLPRIALAALAVAFVQPGDARAAFPGVNGKIAFASDRDGGTLIWLMNPDGGGPGKVANSPAPIGNAAFSADGSRLLFSDFADVWVMSTNGSGQTRLTTDAAFDGQAVFSPDGTKIAFESGRDGNTEIYVMNANGTSPVNLSNNVAEDGSPAWSPDGSKIAFRSNRLGGNYEIWVMDADGNNPVRLTNAAGTDSDPDFSPDGNKIAFTSQRDGNNEIYVMNANGSAQTNLSNNSGEDNSPAFSPDGTKIVFVSHRDGNNEIYVMAASGVPQTNLTNNAADDGDTGPDWQPIIDRDFDGVLDNSDNCVAAANADQANLDGDGAGDVCDDDDDGDGLSDAIESAIGSNPRAADSDGDGKADGADACPTRAAASADGCPVIANPPPIVGTPAFAVTGVPSKIKATKLIASGLLPSVTPDRPVAFLFELFAPAGKLRNAKVGDLVLAERSVGRAPGTRRVRLKVPRRLRGIVRKGVKLRLRITATDEAKRAKTVSRKISVR